MFSHFLPANSRHLWRAVAIFVAPGFRSLLMDRKLPAALFVLSLNTGWRWSRISSLNHQTLLYWRLHWLAKECIIMLLSWSHLSGTKSNRFFISGPTRLRDLRKYGSFSAVDSPAVSSAPIRHFFPSKIQKSDTLGGWNVKKKKKWVKWHCSGVPYPVHGSDIRAALSAGMDDDRESLSVRCHRLGAAQWVFTTFPECLNTHEVTDRGKQTTNLRRAE